jgi:hypothetical protein
MRHSRPCKAKSSTITNGEPDSIKEATQFRYTRAA